MALPETRYASQWDVPPLAEFIGRLGRFGRVLTFDKRGTALSDPVRGRRLTKTKTKDKD